ncbi:hypothetical protein ANOBCDAF_04414 [Pleomorphomonas sp. T1.2MG-36]|uniref:hypothetical protein n=1 Tax=Pleomorphomonas sp. T1.2MG-36 TaxID=3041167 RepID=UPI00247756E6|nr:hypothetical protein [Pleomorphomonas sp. T1.2MG-36]CAI9418913.1 hypothetical protein ANOBCDAF_04414 [Pleomorphomonas sp. T1.2MG-36]
MISSTKMVEEPPPSDDLQAWQEIAHARRLGEFCPEDLVKVVQRIGPNGNQRLLTILVGHLSEVVFKMLCRSIRKSAWQRDDEHIWRPHHKIIVAILTPSSADGKALCRTFKAIVELRALDEMVERKKQKARYISSTLPVNDDKPNASDQLDSADPKPGDFLEQQAHVESVLKKISDPRKREAFRMHMEGISIGPTKKGTPSIAERLGVSSKTAGEWIEEVQTFLKTAMESQND